MRWLVAAVVAVSAVVLLLRAGGELRQADCGPRASAAREPRLRGVNVWTFGALSRRPSNAPGPTYAGGRYIGEPQSAYDFLHRRGIRLVRLPFWWYRIQPTLRGPLDRAYRDALLAEVAKAKAARLRIVLDLHDYRQGRDRGAFLFGSSIQEADFVDVWRRLSELFGKEPAVVAYDLMNQPNRVPASTWENYSEAVVRALREQGDRKHVWLGTPDFNHVEDWPERTPWVSDPNVVYEAHQYFDLGSSAGGRYEGSYSASYDATVLARLDAYVDWLARHGVKGAIGEVGWPSSRTKQDWERWNALAEKWYRRADRAGLWVTYWNATSAYTDWTTAYDNARNSPSAPGIDRAETPARVIEAHGSITGRSGRLPRTPVTPPAGGGCPA